MIRPIPSLSEDSWVTSPERMGDYMLTHFYLCEYSQSYIYEGKIISLPYLIQKYQNDPNGLQTNTQSALLDFFLRYFQNVVCETDVSADPADPSKYILSIYMSYDDEQGNRYNLGKLVDVVNSKIQRVLNQNNYGTDTVPTA